MGLIVRFILLLQLLNIGIHLLPATITAKVVAQRILDLDNPPCRLKFATIDSSYKRTGNCKHFELVSVNFTESSQMLFESIANGLESLYMSGGIVDIIYLPSDLRTFQFFADPSGGTATKIIVYGNTTHKLEHLALAGLQQLPTNVDKLRSLKIFRFVDAPEADVDLTILNEMTQLEQVIMHKVASVTVPKSMQLPVLRLLSICGSSTRFVDDKSVEFPNLSGLTLESNDLRVIPMLFVSMINLTQLSISMNKLQRVHLDMFTNLKQLRTLSLQDNGITEIIAENKVEFPRLEVLSLYNNRLTQLNSTLWIMPVLRYLALSGNQLKRLPGVLNLLTPTMTTTTTTNVQTFLMDGNPVDCDWMNVTVQQIPKVQVLTLDNNNGLCCIYGWIVNPLKN